METTKSPQTVQKTDALGICRGIGKTSFCTVPIPLIRLFDDAEKGLFVSHLIYLQNMKPCGDYGKVAILTANRARRDLGIGETKYKRIKRDLTDKGLIEVSRRQYYGKPCTHITLDEHKLAEALKEHASKCFDSQLEMDRYVQELQPGNEAGRDTEIGNPSESPNSQNDQMDKEPNGHTDKEPNGQNAGMELVNLSERQWSICPKGNGQNGDQLTVLKEQSKKNSLEKKLLVLFASRAFARAHVGRGVFSGINTVRGAEESRDAQIGRGVFSNTDSDEDAGKKMDQYGDLQDRIAKLEQQMEQQEQSGENRELSDRIGKLEVQLEEMREQIERNKDQLKEEVKECHRRIGSPSHRKAWQKTVHKRIDEAGEYMVELKRAMLCPDDFGDESGSHGVSEDDKKAAEYLPELDSIWMAYPPDQRLQKDEALKEFAKAREEGVTLDEIKEGVRKLNVMLSNDRISSKQVPHIKNFIAKRRWQEAQFQRSIFDEAGVPAPEGWLTPSGWLSHGGQPWKGGEEVKQAHKNWYHWDQNYSRKFIEYLRENAIFEQHPDFLRTLWEVFFRKRQGYPSSEEAEANMSEDEWKRWERIKNNGCAWASYFAGYPCFIDPDNKWQPGMTP